MSALFSSWQRFKLVLGIGIIIAVVATAAASPRHTMSQSSPGPLTGWFWSDTTGWISLNCEDVGTCATSNYQVSVDASGNLSGYAWSDAVGWISFNSSHVAGCPQTQVGNTSCQPTITNALFKGWARACAGMNNSSLNQTTPNNACTNSAGSRTDGWDGWISLHGLSPYQYGGAVGTLGEVDGYAWGSDVVGWTEFMANSEYMCSPQAPYCQDATTLCTYDINTCSETCTPCAWECSSGACLSPTPICTISANPQIVTSGASTTITWSSTNAISCTVTGNGDSWPTSGSGTSGSEESSPINGQTVYMQTCTGPDSVSQCSETTTIGPSPAFKEI